MRMPNTSLLLLLGLSLASCLRFIPHRDEASPESLRPVAPGTEASTPEVGNQEAFFSALEENERRLRALLVERSTTPPQASSTTYRIQPSDLIECKVFKSPDLNGIARVRPDGIIAFPLTGDILARGLGEQELAEAIAARLRAYVRNPQVSVSIVEYSGSTVGIWGEAVKPGRVPLRTSSSTLLKALGEAGGPSDNAGGLVYLIPRKSPLQDLENNPMPEAPLLESGSPLLQPEGGIEISLARLTGGSGEPPLIVPLLPGDTVIIPPAGAAQVDGEVLRPGSVTLSAETSLLGAIAASGGLTYSADVEQVEVIRTIAPNKRAAININLEEVALRGGRDLFLRPGDVVRVPSHRGRFATRQIVNVINNTLRFGIGSNYNLGN